MTDTYDLIAIGSGPAGESATELASFFGHRSAVIEKARPGGTVTTTGGAPTKTLREAALYFSGLVEGESTESDLGAAGSRDGYRSANERGTFAACCKR